MSAARHIREGLAKPGPVAYFAVAAASALTVLATAGYLARVASVPSYLPTDIAAYPSAAGHANLVTVASNTRVSTPAQVVYVDASQGVFVPNQIAVRAGTPVELVFTRGRSATSTVRFEGVRAAAHLERDGLVLRLPALSRGLYPFVGTHGSTCGFLFAE